MKLYIEVLFQCVISLFDGFREFILNKPLITILFPASGFGVSSIPTIITLQPTNVVIELINNLTPYIRFTFLILTLVLTVVSLILQFRKLRKKDKDE